MSQFDNQSHNSKALSPALFADCLANSKEIFELIDSVFPVDSCQYYQVLPLSLKNNQLSLGILDPGNEESLKFVNSIAKVFKYNLQLKPIDQQTLEIIIASYNKNSQQCQRQSKDLDRNKTVIDSTVIDQGFVETNYNSRRRLADSAPTIISVDNDYSSPKQSDSSPVIDGLPPDMDFLKDLDLVPPSASKSAKTAEETATLYEIPAEFLPQKSARHLDDKPTIIAEDSAQLLAQEIGLSSSPTELDATSKMTEEKAQAAEDFLTQLLPQLSWQKLLDQAFKYQSEFINLTRHQTHGSIVAKKQKSSQSSVEQIPLPLFCSLIDEIKRMARLPLDLSNHPKKVVLERFYEQERILLRLEFAIAEAQEIVMVHILRGKNLATYEQKQMDKACEQALHLANQLEKTLRRIQACFDSAEFTNIKELQTVQSRINHQLRLLDK